MAKDLYQILGVSRDAGEAEIKKAFRRLARKYHPDVNPGDKAAEERFKEISAAFEILSDPQKRKLYDEFGEDAAKLGWDPEKAKEYRAYRQASRTAAGAGASAFDFEDLFGGGFGGGGRGFDFGDILGDLFGGGRARRRSAARAKGADVEAELTIDFVTAVRGGEREITVKSEDGARKNLKVKIPSGVRDGQKIRLAGQGAPGRAGGPPGDLYIKVKVRPHPRLRRDGNDLYLDVPVTVAEAMLGAKIKVPTLTGPVTVTVPKGSQTGRKLRLKGRGVPARGGRPAGHLYVVLQVKVPTRITAESEEAARTLERFYDGDPRADLKL
ncbi:MAG: J domain-containing protein [Deltaproteobacteria bacterium]|nr:MAG: J domain-containing protein [Deltaproteobacteria bacterium]